MALLGTKFLKPNKYPMKWVDLCPTKLMNWCPMKLLNYNSSVAYCLRQIIVAYFPHCNPCGGVLANVFNFQEVVWFFTMSVSLRLSSTSIKYVGAHLSCLFVCSITSSTNSSTLEFSYGSNTLRFCPYRKHATLDRWNKRLTSHRELYQSYADILPMYSLGLSLLYKTCIWDFMNLFVIP